MKLALTIIGIAVAAIFGILCASYFIYNTYQMHEYAAHKKWLENPKADPAVEMEIDGQMRHVSCRNKEVLAYLTEQIGRHGKKPPGEWTGAYGLRYSVEISLSSGRILDYELFVGEGEDGVTVANDYAMIVHYDPEYYQIPFELPMPPKLKEIYNYLLGPPDGPVKVVP